MYLLDTNLIYELRRPKKTDPSVRRWVESQTMGSLFISAITVFELEYGLALMARKDARQADTLRQWLDLQVLPSFGNRIIPVDTTVAQRCASLHVPDPRNERDALIAATALVHRLTLVTRNTKDFEGTGVGLINPWTQSDYSLHERGQVYG